MTPTCFLPWGQGWVRIGWCQKVGPRHMAFVGQYLGHSSHIFLAFGIFSWPGPGVLHVAPGPVLGAQKSPSRVRASIPGSQSGPADPYLGGVRAPIGAPKFQPGAVGAPAGRSQGLDRAGNLPFPDRAQQHPNQEESGPQCLDGGLGVKGSPSAGPRGIGDPWQDLGKRMGHSGGFHGCPRLRGVGAAGGLLAGSGGE